MPDGRVIHKTTSGNPNDAPVPETERERLFASLLPVWTEDTKFLVDRLEWLNAADPSGRFIRRLDLASIGVAGHSFGGATAAQFCHDDARCKAGIDMDGRLFGSVVHEGFKQPFLFLLSDHGDAWNSPDCRIAADIRSAAARIPGDRLIVTFQGAHHFSFSDQALVKSQIALKTLRAAGVVGDLDGRDGLDCTRRYAREFFDVHLRGAPREVLYQAPLTPIARFETK
jgi:predicted dienelactone hydrolase